MSEIRRAVVLAAGRGVRMGAMTAGTPKPMLPVHGRPMLEHVLEGLARAGVRQFLVVVGYRREVIERHFANWPVPIEFRIQNPVNGTGAAARLAHEFASIEPVLLTFGDILCDASEYVRCARALLDHPETAAVLGVKEVDDPWRGAAVYEEEGRITRIVEKPPPGTSRTRWNSAGLYAFRPIVFEYLERIQPSPRGEYELTSAFEMMLADGRALRISPIQGDWRDVADQRDLQAANADPERSTGD
jgi:dTDP-glucose pyrophosphorylase